VILPKENQKDLRDLPDPVRQEMEFIFAEKAADVLKAALSPSPESLLLVA
jgi:ATP-dependent Lon protease